MCSRWPGGQYPGVPGGFALTEAYVEEFYPLWFSAYQLESGTTNRLAGPAQISSIYHEVVAVNDDTLYASSFLDLTAQPVILTIPATTATYSILTLDPYGDIFSSGIPAQTPGVYGLTGPGYTGPLPPGVTQIAMPLNIVVLIIRTDKYSPSGVNQINIAEMFRASLLLQTLSDYEQNPSGGATAIIPEIVYWPAFKEIADGLIANDPITFLQMLQIAVESSPLSPQQAALSNEFNEVFASGIAEAEIAAGAQAAHQAILAAYLNNRGPTNWVTFTNIGAWGSQVIQRSAIAEFIQYANNYSAAAYYQAFVDQAGNPLDGSTPNGSPNGYVLTFPNGDLPQAKRFWSVTAYTPEGIELIRNRANKYEVASYTPGLQYNADGSLSIYIAQQQPPGVPMANWLPVSSGFFNIMLRVYGPEGTVAAGTYVPPGISPRRY